LLTGFRAGTDTAIGVASDDFTGTRRAWKLPDGTAPIGRVFPNGASITTAHTPTQVVEKAANACAPVLAAGMWPYFSLKPDVAATLAGQLDAHLTALGKWAAGVGAPVYFTVWHEPENDAMGAPSSNYLLRAQNFVKVHTRAYQVVKTAAGDAVRMGPCHLVYKWAPGSPETATDPNVAAAWKVPADARDFIAGDSYTSNWSWTSSGTGLRTKTDFQRWLKLLVCDDLHQVIVAERGVSSTRAGSTPSPEQVQADILRDDAAYLQELGAYALLYWNSGGATDNSSYLLGAPGRAAFLDIAVAAATPPAPAPAVDRYQEGYDAGYVSGKADGVLAGRVEGVAFGRLEGRAEALHDMGEWISAQGG